MDLGLQGKHILITGGTRGIGLACARLYLQEGARVTLCGRSAASRDAALGACRTFDFKHGFDENLSRFDALQIDRCLQKSLSTSFIAL